MASPFGHLTPLLKPWGPLSGTLLRLVREAPDLPGRLLLLPTRGVHAVAIALHTATAADEPLASLADRVRNTHPRDLLRAALPDAATTLYGALARASLPVWPMETYSQLDAVLRSPAANLLPLKPAVTPAQVQNIHEILAGDPVLWRARSFVHDHYTRDHLVTVLGLLRQLGLLREVADLPDGAGRPALQRRLRADLMDAPCPDDGFPEIEGWTRITTVGDLWRVGLRLRVCIRPSSYDAGTYAVRLITGKSVLLHHTELDALAEVRSEAAGLWTLVQAVRTGNGLIGHEVREALERDLERGGLKLVPSNCADALNNLLRVERDRGLGGLADLEEDEVLLPDADDELVA